jgi:hypothetical protein
MSRCFGWTWSAVLLLAVAGCTLDEFVLPQIVVSGPKQVVSGSVSQVAAKLQDGLSDAGIVVQPKQVGGDFRLAGMSKSGTVFCLHVVEKRGPGGTRTLVRMQWDRGGDDELWKLIGRILDSATAVEADNSPPTGP